MPKKPTKKRENRKKIVSSVDMMITFDIIIEKQQKKNYFKNEKICDCAREKC